MRRWRRFGATRLDGDEGVPVGGSSFSELLQFRMGERETSCANQFGKNSKKASRGGAHHGDGKTMVILRDLVRTDDLR
jgi:hypothetical protein